MIINKQITRVIENVELQPLKCLYTYALKLVY